MTDGSLPKLINFFMF